MDAKYSDSRPTYLVGVNYKPSDNILVFAKYSTAFVSGGTSFDVVYDAETVKSIEGGIKADLFDRRVRFNLAVWRARYLNQQASTLGVNIGRPELGAVLVTLGDLTAKGFESELTITPARGLSFNGGLGFTDYKLTSVNPILGTLQTFVLNRRPRWTANLSGQFETQPLFGEATLMVRADAAWRSRMATYNTVIVPPRDEEIRISPAAWSVNSRLALRNMEFGAGKAELAFWAKNIFDNDVSVFPINFSTVASASYERARTFGVDLILDF